MKFTLFSLLLILSFYQTLAQKAPEAYYTLVKQADSLYKSKNYLASAQSYSEAFKSFNWLAYREDRYKAARTWAKAGNPDSAFYQLDAIERRSNFTDLGRLKKEADFTSLHQDQRWKTLLEKVEENKAVNKTIQNKPLEKELKAILHSDQKCRRKSDRIERRYGADSEQVNEHWDLVERIDSTNVVRVTAILDQYGWLGPEVVGQAGNLTLFLVIQHADIDTQEKYLPLMREAVKQSKAAASHLALLEDRVALGRGRKQIYGSQLAYDSERKQYYLSPLEDPDHVDERRAAVNLQPIADYLKNWDLTWNLEQYKKDLPYYEQLQLKK